MKELKIESTNGGSIAKFVGGQTVIDEEQDKLIVPPEASKEAICSDREEDYITIKLIEKVQEQEQDEQYK